jgi:nucleoid-associated protein YgaU
VRAIVVTAVAVAAALATWQLRPPSSPTSAAPDSAIVAGCAWLAWTLALYLTAVVALSAVARATLAAGRVTDAIAVVTPAQVRRLVDAALTVSVAATIVGTSGASPVSAAAPTVAVSSYHPAHASRTSALDWPGVGRSGSTLDWPGLGPVVGRDPASLDWPGVAPNGQSALRHHHHADVGLVTGGRRRREMSTTVIVAPGDSLWTIATRHLGPGASDGAITAAWHRLYAANRALIGADPGVILPGQRLTVPRS